MTAAVLLGFAMAQEPAPRLQFPALRQVRRGFRDGHLKTIPPAIDRLQGRWVIAQGFADVRREGDLVRELRLCETMYDPTTGLGAPPGPFNSIRIHFRDPAAYRSLQQGQFVIVSGRFRIRKEGRLEEAGEVLTALFHVVEAEEGEVPEPGAKTEAAREGIREVTFARLERVKGLSNLPEIRVPDDIRSLDGRWITITGNVLVPGADERVREFTLAKNPWDGCCLGVPPDWNDQVRVILREGLVLADRYTPVQTFSGILRIAPERARGYVVGLYRLEDAVPGAVPPPETEAEARPVNGSASEGSAFPVMVLVGAAVLGLIVGGLLARWRRKPA